MSLGVALLGEYGRDLFNHRHETSTVRVEIATASICHMQTVPKKILRVESMGRALNKRNLS
jgi:hypothetical protein